MKVRHFERDIYDISVKDFWTTFSSCDDFSSYGWNDIFNTTKNFLKHVEQISNQKLKNKTTRYIYDIKALDVLDETGFDYDHIDTYGNTFLQYALGAKRFGMSKDDPSDILIFVSTYITIDIIMQKFKNKNLIYSIDKNGDNILFDMTSIVDTGLDCDKIFDFLKKHPHFDIHHTNKNNRNLLYEAINQNNYNYANYLIDQGVRYDFPYHAHISYKNNDNDMKDNYLYTFMTTTYNDDAWDIFEKFAKKLDICPETGKNIFADHLDWAISKSDTLNESTKKSSQQWISSMIDLVMREEVHNSYDNMKRMVEIIEKTRKKTKSFDQIFADIYPGLRAMALDTTLLIKNDKNTKNKVKI